jgi:hypothetical protein
MNDFILSLIIVEIWTTINWKDLFLRSWEKWRNYSYCKDKLRFYCILWFVTDNKNGKGLKWKFLWWTNSRIDHVQTMEPVVSEILWLAKFTQTMINHGNSEKWRMHAKNELYEWKMLNKPVVEWNVNFPHIHEHRVSFYCLKKNRFLIKTQDNDLIKQANWNTRD